MPRTCTLTPVGSIGDALISHLINDKPTFKTLVAKNVAELRASSAKMAAFCEKQGWKPVPVNSGHFMMVDAGNLGLKTVDEERDFGRHCVEFGVGVVSCSGSNADPRVSGSRTTPTRRGGCASRTRMRPTGSTSRSSGWARRWTRGASSRARSSGSGRCVRRLHYLQRDGSSRQLVRLGGALRGEAMSGRSLFGRELARPPCCAAMPEVAVARAARRNAQPRPWHTTPACVLYI